MTAKQSSAAADAYLEAAQNLEAAQRDAQSAANNDPVIAAIAAVMGEVGSITKGGFNEHQRYKYASISDVVGALQPLMAKHGLIIAQTEIGREIVNGVLAVTYDLHVLHVSGGCLMTLDTTGTRKVPLVIRHTGMSTALNSKGGGDDKAGNKAHTGVRKYALTALFQVPATDADDADKDKDQASPPATPKPAPTEPVAVSKLPPPPPGPPHAIADHDKTLIDWGALFVSALVNSKSPEEAAQWAHANTLKLERFRRDAPNMYPRVAARIFDTAGHGYASVDLPPAAIGLSEKFGACATKKALDNVWTNEIAGKFSDAVLEAVTAEFQKHEKRIAK